MLLLFFLFSFSGKYISIKMNGTKRNFRQLSIIEQVSLNHPETWNLCGHLWRFIIHVKQYLIRLGWAGAFNTIKPDYLKVRHIMEKTIDSLTVAGDLSHGANVGRDIKWRYEDARLVRHPQPGRG